MTEPAPTFDYDYIVVGSGFGGSVSALRLSEKGYSVAVLEQGKRYRAEDFPETNWSLWKYLWWPALRMHGYMRVTILKHVAILSGAGVGGGSLVYANTLPVPKRAFFTSGSWAKLADWETELRPHYATAKKMLGVVTNPTVMTVSDMAACISPETFNPKSSCRTTFGRREDSRMTVQAAATTAL